MPTVETVRGPVDTAQLGRTYMHEHIFVLTPDVQQNYPERVGRRGGPGGRRGGQARRAGGQRGPHHRRPDRGRARPLHPPHPAGRRPGARPQHRGGDRLLHVPRRPVLLPPPDPGHRRAPRAGRAGADGADVRRRHHRGNCRDRRAGRHAEVRHRRGRSDRRGRAGDAGRRRGPPGHRLPDHRAHPPGHRPGPRGAAGHGRGGRRPRPGGARSQRRHAPTSTTCRHWPRPASGSGMDRFGINLRDHVRGPGRHGRRAVPAGIRRAHGPGPRRRLLHRLGRPRRAAVPARSGTTSTSSRTCCRTCATTG